MKKSSGITSFMILSMTLYFLFVWAVQFIGPKFIPTQSVLELSINGADLLSVFESATRLGHRLDVRSVITPEEKLRYPYPIGGITTSYGGLSFLLMWPFTYFNFEKVRILFFVLSVLTIFYLFGFLLKKYGNKSSFDFESILFSVIFITLSGPCTLLLERVNIEVFTPLLLLPFFIEYLEDNFSWKSWSTLGTAIHLKLWPIVFLPLLFYQKKYGIFLKAIALAIFWHLLISPIVPLGETILAISKYNEAAAQMWGWISLTAYSVIKTLGLDVSWKYFPLGFMILMQLLIFFVFISIRKSRTNLNYKDRLLFFSLALITALISPAFVCEYNLINVVLVLIPLLFIFENRYSLFFAILFCNGLWFKEWLGPIKTLALLSLFALFCFDLYNGKYREVKNS